MEFVVTIIGFGNIGRIIGSLLLMNKDFSFIIHIMESNEQVSGAIMDFQQGAQLYENHQVVCNREEVLNTSDFIFHCAGASVPKGKSRFVICQESVAITEAIFKNFHPTKKPFIIVVANPVEVISFITQKITGLPKENIIGTGTFLDSMRMNYAVNQMDRHISSVNAILLGEHGKTVFLSEQLSTVNEMPFHTFFEKDTLDKLMKLVKNSAKQIKETQKSTIYGVGFCAMQIFDSLLSLNGKRLPVSTFIPENLRPILGDSDIYLSLLSHLSTNGSHPMENYFPNKNEVKYLKKSMNLIKSNIPRKYVES